MLPPPPHVVDPRDPIMSRVKGSKKCGEKEKELSSKDVETINEVPCREKISSTNSTSSEPELNDPKSKAKAGKEDNLRKDKKSIWRWKPLKALSLTRNKRFNCCFTLQVHLIEGLPLSFNNSSLCVFWKRKDVLLATPPAKVIQGVAEFQQILTHTCSISGSKSGVHNSAKYEAKHFLVYASTPGAPKLDLGKHQVDLTRLLPLTLEELEEEKTSGKWSTTFRLSGTAKGAVMNVSFGYAIVPDDASTPPNVFTSRGKSMLLMDPDIKPSEVERNVRRAGSLPCFTTPHYSSQDVAKDLHEVLPSSESARASLYKNFDEEKRRNIQHDKPETEVYKENLKPIKTAVCFSPDCEKGKSEENRGNEGNTCSRVHRKPEENLQLVRTNDYPLPDPGIESSKECESNGFSVADRGQGTNFSSYEHVKLGESMVKAVIDVHTVDSFQALDTDVIQESFEDSAKHDSLDELNDSSRESAVVPEICNRRRGVLCTKEIMQELESALNRVSELESLAMESPNAVEAKYENKLTKSESLDDFTESVASEFLSKLGIDHSPMGVSFESEFESPRERLLRQFEKDVLSKGFSLFNFGTGNDNGADDGYDASPEQWKFSAGIKPVSSMPDLQKEYLIESEDVRNKQKVQMLVDLETEALMHEWSLNEKAFQHSPPKDFNCFGSPVFFLPEEPLPLPPLEEGMGPFLQTKDGGFLRSMNPSIFRNSKTGGRLIMQVSNPVVMPAEMGSRIMEILQCLASVGIEKLSMQANKLMPLEEITGKTMQQISWEAKSVLEGTHRQYHLQHDLVTEQDSTCVQKGLKGMLSGGLKTDKFSSSSVDNQKSSKFASLEDLAPLAMDKIEALSVEGLRIQSGMSEEDAPSNIIAQTFGDISALQGKGVNINGSLGLDGAAALHLLNIKDSSNGDFDGIMGLSLTLDEWMRLDSGEIDDIDNISEHTSKLLAAHHANSSFDFNRGSSKGERKRGKCSGRKCGLLGNNITVAQMVQLRDPLRNYEAVGTPMLALIQVEREFVPPKQKIYRCMSEVGNNDDEDDECEIVAKVEMKVNEEEETSEEEAIPQFRITEVHVSGLKIEPETKPRKKVWGTSKQQQSGTRWLIANRMGKNSKNIFMKSKAVSKTSAPTTTNVQHGDTLWSMSSRVFGTGTRWKELAELNPHVRNPNIIIPNKTTRVC